MAEDPRNVIHDIILTSLAGPFTCISDETDAKIFEAADRILASLPAQGGERPARPDADIKELEYESAENGQGHFAHIQKRHVRAALKYIAALEAHPVPEQDGWREQERITTAAIKSGGVIVTVERPLRHGSCINFLNAHGLEYRECQGFLTSTGRFVDRQEAGLIAKAAGQGEPRDVCNGNLFSEDLWDEPTLPEQEAV